MVERAVDVAHVRSGQGFRPSLAVNRQLLDGFSEESLVAFIHRAGAIGESPRKTIRLLQLDDRPPVEVGHHVAQHRARVDGRQLVLVAQQHQTAFIGHRLKERLHQMHVNHRRFIDDHQLVRELVLLRVLPVRRKSAQRRVDRRA